MTRGMMVRDNETVEAFTVALAGYANSAIDPDLAKLAWDYGQTWYRDAHDFAWKLSNTYGISLMQAAGIMAATSIRTRWEANLADAMLAAGGLLRTGLKLRYQKSDAILALPESHTLGDVLQVLRGPKISAFAQNILDPESRVATIDVWMCRALGIPHARAKGQVYENAQTACQNVADGLGIPVPTLQAIVWVMVRGKAE